MEGLELAPPETLKAPEPVKPIKTDQADGLMKLDGKTMQNLDARADQFVEEVMKAKVNSDPFPKNLRIEYEMWSAQVHLGSYILHLDVDS